MKKIIRFFKKQDKRTLMIIGGGLVIVALVVLLLIFKPFSDKGKFDPFDAVPGNSFVVFRINNPSQILHDNNGKNAAEKLCVFPAIKSLYEGLAETEQILSGSSNLNQVMTSSRLYISLHPSGPKNIESLFILELPEGMSATKVYEELSASGKTPLTEKSIEGSSCYAVGKKPFFLYPSGNLIIGSVSEKLLASSISAIDKNNGLGANDDFNKTAAKAAAESHVNVWVNTPLLYRSLGLLFSGETYSSLAFLQTFSTWGNIDINISDQALSFSGLFPLDAQGQSFMNLFDEPNQNATSRLLPLLPANTASAFCYGFYEFSSFFSPYCKRMADNKQSAYDHQSEVEHLNDEAKTEALEKCFYDHLDGLLCVFSTAAGSGQSSSVFCTFPVDESEDLKKSLRAFSEENDEWDTTRFRDAELFTIPAEYGAYSLFGPLFEPISETCIAVTDSSVYIGSTAEQLKILLNNVLSGRSLSATTANEIFKNSISSSWNTFAFLNTALSANNLQNRWLSDSSTIQSASADEKNGQSSILSLTCSRQSDGIVVSGAWIFGKADSTSADSWSTALDAELSSPPVVVSDAKTNDFWVAASDVYDNLYLLDSKGDILWKKSVSDPVHSDFQLLYPGKSEERCIAFTTDKALYIVDMKGAPHASFPITVSEGIASNLLVADYDNKNQYRLLFCDSRGLLNNYSLNGKTTTGWLNPDTRLSGECRVFYRPLGGKDFIVVVNEQHESVFYDRKGKELFRVDGLYYNKGFPILVPDADKKGWLALSADGALLSIHSDGKTSILSESTYGDNLLYARLGNQLVILGDGNLFVSGASEKASNKGLVANSGVDAIKTLPGPDGGVVFFHTNKDIIGFSAIESGIIKKELKADIEFFDAQIQNESILLISSQGKTIILETISPDEMEDNP